MYRLVPDILRKKAEEVPDNLALSVDGCERLTFREWEEHSNCLGRELAKTIQRKSTVGLYFSNPSACLHYTAYFAVQKAGGIPFPISPRLGDEEILHLLSHAEPALCIAEREGEERMARLLESTRGKLMREEEARAAADEGENSPFQVEVDPEDPCDLIYTSGTTGLPKAVATSHASINYWDDQTMGQYFPSMPGAKTLNAVPIYTFAGIHGMMLFALRNSLTHCILPKFSARRFLEVIQEEQVLIAYLVPAMAELITKELPPLPDTSSLKLLSFGTAPMKAATILKLRELFPMAILCNLYGLTEGGTSTCACFFYPGEPEEVVQKKLKSVGQPIPPTKVLILDEEGNPLPPGKVGEIVFEHPAKARRYFRNEAMTHSVWKEEGKNRIYTGDLGKLDDEGNLTISDRKKDMIIRGGFNIFPSELEEILRQHPAIDDAAVVGIPHEVLGEDVKAFVILKEGRSLTLEELQEYLKPKVADYKVPRKLALVSSFPRSPIGKVLKRELQEMGE